MTNSWIFLIQIIIGIFLKTILFTQGYIEPINWTFNQISYQLSNKKLKIINQVKNCRTLLVANNGIILI